MQGDQARQTEGETLHNNFSQTLLRDHFSVNISSWGIIHVIIRDFPKLERSLIARPLNNRNTHWSSGLMDPFLSRTRHNCNDPINPIKHQRKDSKKLCLWTSTKTENLQITKAESADFNLEKFHYCNKSEELFAIFSSLHHIWHIIVNLLLLKWK